MVVRTFKCYQKSISCNNFVCSNPFILSCLLILWSWKLGRAIECDFYCIWKCGRPFESSGTVCPLYERLSFTFNPSVQETPSFVFASVSAWPKRARHLPTRPTRPTKTTTVQSANFNQERATFLWFSEDAHKSNFSWFLSRQLKVFSHIWCFRTNLYWLKMV